jgi:very-short-patch-repair endonuclease
MASTNRSRARKLRKELTDAEQALWQRLRYKQLDGHKFRRQQPLGPYIVDFACFEKRLVIEVDGGQHAEKPLIDAKRTAWLTSQGFRVVRFWNNDVLNSIESVLAVIQEKLTHA